MACLLRDHTSASVSLSLSHSISLSLSFSLSLSPISLSLSLSLSFFLSLLYIPANITHFPLYPDIYPSWPQHSTFRHCMVDNRYRRLPRGKPEQYSLQWTNRPMVPIWRHLSTLPPARCTRHRAMVAKQHKLQPRRGHHQAANVDASVRLGSDEGRQSDGTSGQQTAVLRVSVRRRHVGHRWSVYVWHRLHGRSDLHVPSP